MIRIEHRATQYHDRRTRTMHCQCTVYTPGSVVVVVAVVAVVVVASTRIGRHRCDGVAVPQTVGNGGCGTAVCPGGGERGGVHVRCARGMRSPGGIRQDRSDIGWTGPA